MEKIRALCAASLVGAAACSGATEPAAAPISASVRFDSLGLGLTVEELRVRGTAVVAAVQRDGADGVQLVGTIGGSCIPTPTATATASVRGDTLHLRVRPVVDDLPPGFSRCAFITFYPYRVSVRPVDASVRYLRFEQEGIPEVMARRDTVLALR